MGIEAWKIALLFHVQSHLRQDNLLSCLKQLRPYSQGRDNTVIIICGKLDRLPFSAGEFDLCIRVSAHQIGQRGHAKTTIVPGPDEVFPGLCKTDLQRKYIRF